MPIIRALVMLGVLAIALCGCDLISVAEPPKEYDMQVDVLSIVNPDTLQTGQLCRIQVCFQSVCGGTFSGNQRAWDGRQLTLSPIIHVVPQTVCPAVYSTQTIIDSTRFSQSGTYDLVVHGRNGYFEKVVNVVSSFPTRNLYSIRCRFQSVDSANQKGSPFYTTDFQFLNRPPSYSFAIIADASGEWDTTFVDTLPRVKYTISDYYTFEALQGVKEDMTILVP